MSHDHQPPPNASVEVEIRPIDARAADALAPLVAASTAEGFRFVARLVAELASGTPRYDGGGAALLGAYDGARLLAVGGVARDPYGDDPSVGRLRHLYVLPGARRRGIGGRLVRALESVAREWYDEVVLRTDTADAARFYEARGYAPLAPGGTATHRRRLAPDRPAARRP